VLKSGKKPQFSVFSFVALFLYTLKIENDTIRKMAVIINFMFFRLLGKRDRCFFERIKYSTGKLAIVLIK